MAIVIQGNLKDAVDQLTDYVSAVQRKVDLEPNIPGAADITTALTNMKPLLREARDGADRAVRAAARRT